MTHLPQRAVGVRNTTKQRLKINVGFAPDDFRRVSNIAYRQNLPMSELIRRAVQKHIDELEAI